MSGLQKQLQKFLLQTISSHDAASESFYHGMVIGLCAIMNNMYYVSSNRESGAGRYDVQLLPHNKVLPGILIELKVLRETVPRCAPADRDKKLCGLYAGARCTADNEIWNCFLQKTSGDCLSDG